MAYTSEIDTLCIEPFQMTHEEYIEHNRAWKEEHGEAKDCKWYVIRSVDDFKAIFLCDDGEPVSDYELIPVIETKLQEYGIVFVGYWDKPPDDIQGWIKVAETEITTDTSLVISDIKNQMEWYIDDSDRFWHSACAAAIRVIEILKHREH